MIIVIYLQNNEYFVSKKYEFPRSIHLKRPVNIETQE